MANVSVLILTANRLPLLRECIAALRRQSLPPAQLLVIDNGSTDGSREWLAAQEGVQVLLRDGNGSFAEARNAAVSAATGEWIAFLDDDCEADPCWLERLLATAERTGSFAVGGMVLPAEELPVPEEVPPEALWAAGLLPESYLGPLGGRAILPTTSNLLAATGLLREFPFQELAGDFEQGSAVYLQGREDAEWWRTIRRAGVATAIAGRAIVWHHIPAARVAKKALLERAAMDGRAAWNRNPSEGRLRAAARDLVSLPRQLLSALTDTDRTGGLFALRLWATRQAALLGESIDGNEALAPARRFELVLAEGAREAAAAGKATLRAGLARVVALLRSEEPSPREPRELLVVLHDLLGDSVLAGPMVRQLAEGLPEARITVLTGPVGAPVLRRALVETRVSVRVAPRNSLRLWRDLMELSPDAVLLGYAHGLAAWPLFALGAPVLGWPHDQGLGRQFWAELLAHRVEKTQRKHELAALLDLAGAFGVRTRLEEPAFSPGTKAMDRAARLRAEAGGGDYVVVHVERSGRWKIWPADRMEDLVGRLREQGVTVFLVGARGDRPLAREIARRTGAHALHGALDSEELAALIAGARVFVGCDSGPAHVASAVGTPALLLFGGTRPERWGPVGASARRAVVLCPGPGDWLADEAEGLPEDAAMRFLGVDEVWEALTSMGVLPDEEKGRGGRKTH
jgi:ADP-heptose:LPS heptosyltransferase